MPSRSRARQVVFSIIGCNASTLYSVNPAFAYLESRAAASGGETQSASLRIRGLRLARLRRTLAQGLGGGWGGARRRREPPPRTTPLAALPPDANCHSERMRRICMPSIRFFVGLRPPQNDNGGGYCKSEPALRRAACASLRRGWLRLACLKADICRNFTRAEDCGDRANSGGHNLKNRNKTWRPNKTHCVGGP